MLSVVIPTLNAERHLPRCLAALVEGALAGLVRDVVVSDGGSGDLTACIAEEAGATLLAAPRGRGPQLRAGAAAARGDWFLFLHADTVLDPGWSAAVERFIAAGGAERAAVFAFALDDTGNAARRLEAMVRWRCRVFGLPYGDQGLLMSRAHYLRLGGYADLPLMEDVDIVRRIGRRHLAYLPVRAVTSADRYRREGYWRRPLRNLGILALYLLGVPPRRLVKLYG